MPTITVNGSTVNFSIETENFIDYLQDRNYAIEDMHDFIAAYGEDNFRKYYEEYVGLGEQYDYKAVDTFIKLFGIDDMPKYFEDAYKGSNYWSFKDYAAELFEGCWGNQIPEEISWYFDMDSYARDLLNSGYYYEDNHVFCDY